MILWLYIDKEYWTPFKSDIGGSHGYLGCLFLSSMKSPSNQWSGISFMLQSFNTVQNYNLVLRQNIKQIQPQKKPSLDGQ